MSNTPPITYTDKFLIKDIVDQNGTTLPTRRALQVTGTGVQCTDDPVNGLTVLEFTAASSAGQGSTSVDNGLNSDVPTLSNPTLRLTGPTGPFSVGGLSIPATETPAPGTTIDLVNTTPQLMTIVHEDASSTAWYRLAVGGGRPITLPPYATVRLVYDGTASRWRLQNPGLARPTVIHAEDYVAVTVNDTAAAQACLNAATLAHGTAYFSSRVWAIGVLSLAYAFGVTIRGERSTYASSGESTGTVFEWTGGMGTQLTITDSQQVRFEHIHFYGTNDNVDVANTGVQIVSDNDPASYYITFDKCVFSEWGTGVLWGSGSYQSDKGGFFDCEFWNYTRYGIYVNSANALDGGRIDGCIFSASGSAIANGIHLNSCGLLRITNCIGGGYGLHFIHINASLVNNVQIQNCESEGGPDSYDLYIVGANDTQTYTLLGNTFSAESGVYVGGIARVVGIGNCYNYNLTLDAAGAKYIAIGDRFNQSGGTTGLGATCVITENGGVFVNHDGPHAAPEGELWTVGQITWQPPYSGETGCAGEQCTRSGRRAAAWVENTEIALGAYAVPTVDNEHVYVCTTAGTTNATTQPNWTTGSGSTQPTDGTVVWKEAGASALFQAFGPLNHYTGTAAPTSGYYTPGAIVWNTAPTAYNESQTSGANGGNIGWVCIASGSPGTWAPFGATLQPANVANQIAVTEGTVTVPFGYNRLAEGTLTGDVVLNFEASGTLDARWIIDATLIDLNGYTIKASLNSSEWSGTIGTAGIYLFYSGSTAYLFGVELTP